MGSRGGQLPAAPSQGRQASQELGHWLTLAVWWDFLSSGKRIQTAEILPKSMRNVLTKWVFKQEEGERAWKKGGREGKEGGREGES